MKQQIINLQETEHILSIVKLLERYKDCKEIVGPLLEALTQIQIKEIGEVLLMDVNSPEARMFIEEVEKLKLERSK